MKQTSDVEMTQRQFDEKFLREAYENFPEASMCLRCDSWKYDEFVFKFTDDEGKQHTVTMAKALKGLKVFQKLVNEGRLPGLGLPSNYMADTGNWDAFAFDALNQCAIYGEVIYG